MMHGEAAAQLTSFTVDAADSLCQELTKQQGNKIQAPKPSLEGRLVHLPAGHDSAAVSASQVSAARLSDPVAVQLFVQPVSSCRLLASLSRSLSNLL